MMDNSPLKEPVAHKLPLSDEVMNTLAVHHLARRIVVRCSGCPFDYALVLPEEMWFSGKAEQYRESLIEYLRTSECGRHPSHIVWTRGIPLAVGGRLRSVQVLEENREEAAPCATTEAKNDNSYSMAEATDHLYWAIQCPGWCCRDLVFLCDLGSFRSKPDTKRKPPKRFDVTCPVCHAVGTYERKDVRQVRAQAPPGDWVDHPVFAAEMSAKTQHQPK